MDGIRNEIDIDAFEKKYRDAKGYHKRALQFMQEQQSHTVVYNVAAVALENYLIALCELYGICPGNHNYVCLTDAIEEVLDMPTELKQEIRSLDKMFGICSLENFYIGIPESSDSQQILELCDQVEALFDQTRVNKIKRLGVS